MLRWVACLRFVSRTIFRPKRVENELNKELQYHLEREIQEGLRAGLTPEEARYAAMRTMGAVEKSKEECRDGHRMKLVQRLEARLRDVRFSFRMLGRAPAFTATVVLTVALGIGANTAVFSVIDAVLLRPLPFPNADQLVSVRQKQERTADTVISPVRLEDWNSLNSSFQAMTGYYAEDISETSGDIPERVRQATVAMRFFEVWSMAPALGRAFTQADHQEGAERVVVISNRYWHSRFAGDPNILGKSIRIGSISFSIVGVQNGMFRFPDPDVNLWVPDRIVQGRRSLRYIGVGRLKPNVTIDQARIDLRLVQARLAEQYPDTDRDIGVELSPLKDSIVGSTGRSLWLLYGAVSVLLVIACVNIAALLLARATQRQQEAGVRMSLGASSGAVAAQVLTETAMLAAAGAILGVLVAAATSFAFRTLSPGMPRSDEIGVDHRILLYTLGALAVVTIGCGAVPAIRSARAGLAGALAGTARALVGERHTVQWALVGVQVALSVTLLAGAGLLVRSFHELSNVNPGFPLRRILSFRVSASWAELGNVARMRQQVDGIIEALRTMPGVDAAAVSVVAPGVPTSFQQEFRLLERSPNTDGRIVSGSNVVSPSYFETMQMPLVAGEFCSRQAALSRAMPEVMVNRSFANRYIPGSSAVGLHLADMNTRPNVPPNRVVGIVADARERGIDRSPEPTVYFCDYPAQPFRVYLVRTADDPERIAQAVRLKIKELEPLRSVYDMAPLEEWVGDAFGEYRLRAVVLASFALTALSLACVGLYGTLTYVVSLRRREVGLRLALGALRRDIVRHYVLKGMSVAVLACGAGLVTSAAAGHVVTSMLYGISPYDPTTLIVVVFVVLFVSAIASLLPATRVSLLDPMKVLRED
jgi:putative ABC transport system permease protein